MMAVAPTYSCTIDFSGKCLEASPGMLKCMARDHKLHPITAGSTAEGLELRTCKRASSRDMASRHSEELETAKKSTPRRSFLISRGRQGRPNLMKMIVLYRSCPYPSVPGYLE